MSTEISDSDYWVAGYYSPDYNPDPQPIDQPICWGINGGKCWQGCVYCPHTKDSKGNDEIWWISELGHDNKPIQCATYGYERTADPKFCMPTCDKDNYSGHCRNGTCICPSQYSDCKKENQGVLGGKDGDPFLCSGGTHPCCSGPGPSCPVCIVKSSAPGATDTDYKTCNASKVISKHGCHVPSGESSFIERKRSRPKCCGNYTILALAWT